MKKILIIFTFLITFVLSSASVFAEGNFLHTITLEKNDTGYNVILGSDKMTKVTKKTPGNNELILELKGISSADSVNALYKGTNSIDGLVIETPNRNKLRIHITANDISNSTVIMEPIQGEPAIVGESVPLDKVLWVLFVLSLISVIVKFSKHITEDEEKISIRKDIKNREIQMYKKYRKDISIYPTLRQKDDVRLRTLVKKIDRKIDERLISNIK